MPTYVVNGAGVARAHEEIELAAHELLQYLDQRVAGSGGGET